MTTALVGAAVAAPATLAVVDAVERRGGGGGGNHLCGQHSSWFGALAFSLFPFSKS